MITFKQFLEEETEQQRDVRIRKKSQIDTAQEQLSASKERERDRSRTERDRLARTSDTIKRSRDANKPQN